MKNRRRLRALVGALNKVIDIAQAMLTDEDEEIDPQEMMAQYLADLTKARKVGPMREWLRDLEKKTVTILVDEKGVKSRELSEILGTSIEAARQYAFRLGITFRADNSE